MPINIIADENIDKAIIEHLRKLKFNIYSIFEKSHGISDLEIIKLANKNKSIVLTEDKDFGEWIFAHHEKSASVIFLRYNYKELHEIKQSLENVIFKFNDKLYNKFIVITKNRVRYRDIL